MVITVRYKTFNNVAPLHAHELLARATLKLTLWFSDGHSEDLPAAWDKNKLEWRAWTTGAHAHAAAMELDYTATVPWQGGHYEILRIVQGFALIAVPAALPPAGDRAVVPTGWVYIKPGGSRVMRTVPLALHPLLELSGLYAPIVTVNALMTDVTDLWDAMHGENLSTKMRKAMLDPAKIKVRILAHLGGIPFAWFVCIPKAAEESSEVSPHVFYMPNDFGALSYEQKSIKGLASKEHDSEPRSGRRIPNNYILNPIADEDFARVSPNIPDGAVPFRAGLLRNVTNVFNHPVRGIVANVWPTPMGLSRAVYESKVSQVLFVPLRLTGFPLGAAQKAELGDILEAAMKVLWTQTESICQGSSKALTIGKYVLSCWSDSGVALWDAAMTNVSRIKAVIAIEPQNMNTATNKGGNYLGKDVIRKLIENDVRVVLVGRHKQGNYNPQVSSDVRSKIVFLPDDTSGADTDGLEKISYDEVFKYPPDITKNHFMIYRTYRLWEPDQDLVLRKDAASKQLLSAAKAAIQKAKTPPAPATYQELINRIFIPKLAEDSPGNFYLHHFALSGGRKLKLPPLDPNDAYYNVAVQYKTFLQEALEIVG
jgi:hypothetical protein